MCVIRDGLKMPGLFCKGNCSLEAVRCSAFYLFAYLLSFSLVLFSLNVLAYSLLVFFSHLFACSIKINMPK